MKKLTIFLSIITLKLSLYGQLQCSGLGQAIVPVENGVCNYDPFVCVFEDYFDGAKLDLSKWDPMLGVTRDAQQEHNQQWYSPNNIEVSNGTLKLISKIQPLYNQCFDIWENNTTNHYCHDFFYTSAEIHSKYKFPSGRYEIRCKIPKGKGFLPAFWTFGSPWSEIDVFEFGNSYDAFHNLDLDKSVKEHCMNTHYDFDGDGNSENCMTKYIGPDFSADFHTFSVTWTNHKVEWYVDGVLKRRQMLMVNMLGQEVDCNGIEAWKMYVADKSFPRVTPVNIIANLAIASANEGPDNTPFPSAMEIEFIRYYKQASCSGPVTITSTPALNLSPIYYNSIIGTTININNAELQSGQQLTVIGRDKIVLGPGFKLSPGSNFHARISAGVCPGAPGMTGNDESTMANTTGENTLQDKTTAIAQVTESEIELFPNPTNAKFIVNFKGRDVNSYTILLTDIQGNELPVNTKIATSNLEVDISNFSPGMYFLKITNTKNGRIQSHKVVKQ